MTFPRVWRCVLRLGPKAVWRKKRDPTVDAIVAATAVELAPSVVITGDKTDLGILVDGFDVKVSLV